jgi:hypothetical protein
MAASSMTLALSLFLFGASIGAIDVVMNVQALLVERGSGENLMPGFHGLSALVALLALLEHLLTTVYKAVGFVQKRTLVCFHCNVRHQVPNVSITRLSL